MAAYLVITGKVTDPQAFAPYAQQAAQLLAHHGGQYLVRGGTQDLLEGDDDGRRVVISRFADRAAALAFWNSDAYAHLKTLRAGTGVFDVRLVEGD